MSGNNGKYKVTKTSPGSAAQGGARKKAADSASRSKSMREVSENAKKASEKLKAEQKRRHDMRMQFMPFVLVAAAVILTVFFFAEDAGLVGTYIVKWLFFGMFGGASYIIPLILIYHAIFLRRDSEAGIAGWKVGCTTTLFAVISMLVHVFTVGEDFTFNPITLFSDGLENIGGGLIGGMIASLLLVCFKYIATLIILFCVAFLFLLFIIGLTPRTFYIICAKKMQASRERRLEEKRIAEELAAQRESAAADDYYGDDDYEPETSAVMEYDRAPAIDEEIFNEALLNNEEAFAAGNEPAPGGEVDLKRIFINPDDAKLLDDLAEAYLDGKGTSVVSSISETDGSAELSVDRGRLVAAEEKPKQLPIPKPKPEYVFPSLQLLTKDTAKQNPNIKEELYENAQKLVETLASFNVRTRIVGVSRGPTITRYELLPEAGIRVRSISNLIDDIALNLATTGVRIEAPIPGKNAVGIEVPHKNAEIVHLRTLIEDKCFNENKSKITAALGEDVAGQAIYLDIAKMPHLLIAGATGMGKSVCINSIIVSLLYKASPDEVKLILIDPKKVELNIYNGLMHLLVPVVSDPKKAAGSLSWAVSEMERRFGLIESVGVRDLHAYNEITKNDPEHDHLPQIVIIIDELADLMMTAPDDVEDSICRLAQKARAAGMHLIIGTQRPSVDVITGLIKSNIPSRIAFTVASQVDSRTIIDKAGAENLIGRGDMLYNPVGASKPMRVQGAFVSEVEVERVVTFIKERNPIEEAYNTEVIEQIERSAELVGAGKKGAAAIAAGDSGDEDAMLRPAIELAIESGKISTSLIQRRLSLGYGRAAKILDRMQQLGYISEPDGQKPREVLITRQEFMEMALRDRD